MRTTTADVYGLTIPAGVVSAFGDTTHRYTLGEGVNITVNDMGFQNGTVVDIEVATTEGVILEERQNVAKNDVKAAVLGYLARYRY